MLRMPRNHFRTYKTPLYEISKTKRIKINDYPDLQEDEPTLLRNLIQLAKPSESSHIDMYLDSTIKYVKEKQRKKANEVRLNNAAFGNNLYFVDITFPRLQRNSRH